MGQKDKETCEDVQAFLYEECRKSLISSESSLQYLDRKSLALLCYLMPFCLFCLCTLSGENTYSDGFNLLLLLNLQVYSLLSVLILLFPYLPRKFSCTSIRPTTTYTHYVNKTPTEIKQERLELYTDMIRMNKLIYKRRSSIIRYSMLIVAAFTLLYPIFCIYSVIHTFATLPTFPSI